jgi:hypothetical protein
MQLFEDQNAALRRAEPEQQPSRPREYSLTVGQHECIRVQIAPDRDDALGASGPGIRERQNWHHGTAATVFAVRLLGKNAQVADHQPLTANTLTP